MNEPQRYVEDVLVRFEANGYEVSHTEFNGLPVVVGYKSQFRWRWFATKMHLFVVVAPFGYVTADWLEYLARSSLQFAEQAKGDFRGFQSGVAVISALAGTGVDQQALTYAEREIVKMWAAFAWPVAVDTTTHTVTSHKGRPVIGSIYTKWMRQQISACLDTPR